jgi:hypothetical protein
MNVYFNATVILSIATAICAGVAAYYWFRSSRTEIGDDSDTIASIDDNPAEHILGAQADISIIRIGLRHSAKLNGIAAIWSGFAALFAALASITGALSLHLQLQSG